MAANVAIPNTFIAATPADPAQVNANFVALRDWVNTNAVQLDGSKAMTGLLSAPAGTDPATADQYARKAYVDNNKTILFNGTPATIAASSVGFYTVNTINIPAQTKAGKVSVIAVTRLTLPAGTNIGTSKGSYEIVFNGTTIRGTVVGEFYGMSPYSGGITEYEPNASATATLAAGVAATIIVRFYLSTSFGYTISSSNNAAVNNAFATWVAD